MAPIENAPETAGLNVVLLFGIVVLGGAFGARLFQRFHIPQVVGSVVIGVLLCEDVLNVITQDMVERLEPFTIFALGILGFMIGGELRADVFRKYGRQFFTILFSQGLGAFVLVATAGSALLWLGTGSLSTSVAVGIVLGAIASATAPAATVNVLWEYKTRGPLTAAVLAIVALDDALALLLYRGAVTGADALLGNGEGSVVKTTLLLLGEILGAILLGFLAGVLLFYLLKFVRTDDKILDFAVASLLLIVGVSIVADVEPLLPAMTLGITIANLAPRQSRSTFSLMEKFSPPIYIAFFVLAGAHMEFGKITPWLLVMIAAYVLFRGFGKISGSWFGAKISKSPLVVQKYLGLCLLPQAGVAIGLAILSRQKFGADIGHMIIIIVMMSTFLMELIGPVLVRIGVKRAGEVGMNVTEDDLIRAYRVRDVMDGEPTIIQQNTSLNQVLEVFSTSDSLYYPMVNEQHQLRGVITVDGIKEMFANHQVSNWLLAYDVAEPAQDKTTADARLEETLEYMDRYNLDTIPVIAKHDSDRLLGVLDKQAVSRKISAEVLRRRRRADEYAYSETAEPATDVTAKRPESPEDEMKFHLRDYLRIETLEPNLEGTTKDEVIDELLALLEKQGLILDVEAARKAILAREKQMPTGMQDGVAIPHGRTDAVTNLVCAVGVKPEGVDFGALDGKPAQIIVLALTPASESKPYLQFMAAVVAALDKAGIEDILSAGTQEGLYKSLVGAS